ncbi:nuclease A inhibitor family protein [Chamaesiphon minutus]|uniref:Uncharacterized protein n=1 Tax=Chamaesiphon minutus (strain ATCC 27169 / PCC 6605) TaxID=1173020 RepID=K9UP16_CHAP6|nr:nuclease A inhibitor family protein [Chamaesiphon minutus]AFY96181.1 hypothetical protein Cha6605_5294 [Chamaesiphon minutus PCC 6605]
MHPEEIFDELEVLVNGLPFNLPHHEDGGVLYPFAWNSTSMGEFNSFNLLQSNEWIKPTDVNVVIKQWKELEYAKSFNELSSRQPEVDAWQDGIEALNREIDKLISSQAYYFSSERELGSPNGIIIAQMQDGNWVGISSKVYVASGMPIEVIDLSPIDRPTSEIEQKNYEIVGIISQIPDIAMNGDFADYACSHVHKMIFGMGETRESAWENTLKASGMLKTSQFNNIYKDRDYLIDYYYCDETEEEVQDIFDRYAKIERFLKQELSNPIVYRISSWISEHIYIIGQVKGMEGDKLGIYIKSNFVYNP